ncbi:MAG: type II toxin-antitoxin system HicB family antitoxin [Verrucomicrobia bacterium]|nr:type II toxin-antitoxin system HicB family antitoxin [Verrucomicrobiota bacterium]
MNYTYPIILKESEEGYAVGCPALPGCWSQGANEEEAIENIKIAIREYLEVVRESYREEDFKEIEVAI